jgi:hypothetical protein
MIALPYRRTAMALLAGLVLAGCASQMDAPPANFGQALKAAKDAQRITGSERDDGMRPMARELPAGAMRPAPAGADGRSGSWGQMPGAGGSSGVLVVPAGSR